MIIDCISDLHGNFPKLDGGDLLIVAGDLTGKNEHYEYQTFFYWIGFQDYRKKIFISGNHDSLMSETPSKKIRCPARTNFKTGEYYEICEYLCDSGTEFEGLKIWGSPWTKTFEGMNPKCKAFTVDTEEELAEKWKIIPNDVDILITHSPAFGCYDWLKNHDGTIGPSVGSVSLWMKMLSLVPNLKLHITGHIHEAYGNSVHANGIHLVNASIVNERYEHVNKPIRVIL